MSASRVIPRQKTLFPDGVQPIDVPGDPPGQPTREIKTSGINRGS